MRAQSCCFAYLSPLIFAVVVVVAVIIDKAPYYFRHDLPSIVIQDCLKFQIPGCGFRIPSLAGFRIP